MPPVVLIIFNRPDLVERQVEVLSALPLEQLFVIADGPRSGTDDSAKCAAARDIITSTQWPCEVHQDFADTNIGCAKRIVSGLDWVFSRVDRAVILEDDCLAHPDFFQFCEELLERYADDAHIMQICGTNLLSGIEDKYSYRFSHHVVCWGWATWSRAWACNDLSVNLNHVELSLLLQRYMEGNGEAIKYWNNVLDMMRRGELDTWDYPWQLSIWRNAGSCVIPNRNMVFNAGFRSDATHTADAESGVANLPLESLDFPLIHPPDTDYGYQYDARFVKRYFADKRSTRRLRNLVSNLSREARELLSESWRTLRRSKD